MLEGIICITGKQGGGKTYYSVTRIVEELAKGRVVYSNIKLNWEKVGPYFKSIGLTVPASNYRQFQDLSMWHREINEGCAVFLDEVQLYYNNRDFKETDKRSRELLEFIPQARKNGVYLAFITQHESNVDTQFLRQAAAYYRCQNLQAYPFIKAFIPLSLGLINVVKPDGKTVVERIWMRRKKLYFDFYDTRQKYKTFDLGGAPAAEVIGTRKGSPWASIWFALAVGFACFGWWKDSRDFKVAPDAVSAPVVERKGPVVYDKIPDPVVLPVAAANSSVSGKGDPPGDPDDVYPTVVKHWGRTSQKGEVSEGHHWDPAIVLNTGRTLRVGSWLDGVIITWLWVTPEICLLTVRDPMTQKDKQLKLYDHRLLASERNQNSNFRKPSPVGSIPSGESGSGESEENNPSWEGVKTFQSLQEKYFK